MDHMLPRLPLEVVPFPTMLAAPVMIPNGPTNTFRSIVRGVLFHQSPVLSAGNVHKSLTSVNTLYSFATVEKTKGRKPCDFLPPRIAIGKPISTLPTATPGRTKDSFSLSRLVEIVQANEICLGIVRVIRRRELHPRPHRIVRCPISIHRGLDRGIGQLLGQPPGSFIREQVLAHPAHNRLTSRSG